MSNLTPFGKRLAALAVSVALLAAAAFVAPRVGVDPRLLIEAGLGLLKDAPTPEPTQAVPSPTPSQAGPV